MCDDINKMTHEKGYRHRQVGFPTSPELILPMLRLLSSKVQKGDFSDPRSLVYNSQEWSYNVDYDLTGACLFSPNILSVLALQT